MSLSWAWALVLAVGAVVPGCMVKVEARKHPTVLLYILAGEGNVEGFASLGHLHQLATANKDTNNTPSYQHLLSNTTEKGSWSVRDDVFVTYDHHRNEEWMHGPLGPQFGATANHTFGPELQMGHFLGNLYNEKIVIVKAGWNGRSLAKDFKSPVEYATDEEHHDPKTQSTDKSGGFQWYRMIQSIQNTANHLDTMLGRDYKYAKIVPMGLVWWHGYTDLESNDVTMRRDYATHLRQFVAAVRAELKTPGLPVVVAELGGRGSNTTNKAELAFRTMQQSVVYESYMSNMTMRFVRTSPYVRDKPNDATGKDYHYYYGRADTMLEIGQAFGKALADMDWEKNQAGDNWFLEEADVGVQNYERSSEVYRMGQIVLAVSAVMVIVALLTGTAGARRTWNTAFARLRTSDTVATATDNDDDQDIPKQYSDGQLRGTPGSYADNGRTKDDDATIDAAMERGRQAAVTSVNDWDDIDDVVDTVLRKHHHASKKNTNTKR